MLQLRAFSALLLASVLASASASAATAGHRAPAPSSNALHDPSEPAQPGTVLYAFTGTPDGSAPGGDLLWDHGVLYGTTSRGGSIGSNRGACVEYGCGTVFKLTPLFGLTPPIRGQGTWTESLLHAFAGGSGGAFPFQSGLVSDAGGALYGTASQGGYMGGGCSYIGCGIVYRIKP